MNASQTKRVEGCVGFERLKIFCTIGVEVHERCCLQEIFVDLKVKSDLNPAALSDQLADALDYTRLVSLCVSIAEKKYGLLEAYAREVLEQVFAKFKVEKAWICIRKPGAIENAECSFIEMEAAWDGL